MVSTSPTGVGEEWIPTLAAAGFDYAEIALAETVRLNPATRRQIKDALTQHGLRAETMNNFFPRTLRLTGSNIDKAAIQAYVDEALEVAAGMGAEIIVFGSGPAKHVPEGFPMEAAYRQVVDLLQTIGPKAKAKNLTIVIEPLRQFECNLINTFAEGVQLARDVGHEAVRVLVDYYHLTVENEPLEHIIKDGRTFLRHAHYAKPAGRVYPTPATIEPADRNFFRALNAAGYDQRVSVEAYTDDYGRAAAPARETMRQLSAD